MYDKLHVALMYGRWLAGVGGNAWAPAGSAEPRHEHPNCGQQQVGSVVGNERQVGATWGYVGTGAM